MTTLTALKLTLKHSEALFFDAMNGNLTFTQYQVLDAVRNATQLPTQFVLTELTGVDRSTLSDVVRRLVGKGLLTRKRKKDDARAWQVQITKPGLDILKDADKNLRPIERNLRLAEAAE